MTYLSRAGIVSGARSTLDILPQYGPCNCVIRSIASRAVNPEPGIQYGYWAVIAIYALLTVVTIAVLRHMTRSVAIPAAPQDADADSYRVT